MTSNGMFTTNRAILTPFAGRGDPQLADCAKVPFSKWRTNLLAKDIAADARFCVITSANRAGTDLDRVSFSFTVWTGADD